MASPPLSGSKNNTDGSLDVAINAMFSVCRPHNFLGINHDGQCAIIRTKGNRYGHVVLRGGGGKPNYDSVTVALCEQALAAKKLSTNLVVDCSHENSRKDPALQPLVLHDCVHQILEGNQSLIGFMLESNINFGKQAIPADLSQLQYGVSVTDGCIDWATTEKMFARDPYIDSRMCCPRAYSHSSLHRTHQGCYTLVGPPCVGAHSCTSLRGLMCIVSDCQDRAWCRGRGHLSSNTTQEHVLQPSVLVCPHDDEISVAIKSHTARPIQGFLCDSAVLLTSH